MTVMRAKKPRTNRSSRADASIESEARLAVNLPVGTHRQLKAKAAEEGTSIRDYIVQMLRKNGIG